MTLANMRAQGVRPLWVVCDLYHHEAVVNVDTYGEAIIARLLHNLTGGNVGRRASASSGTAAANNKKAEINKTRCEKGSIIRIAKSPISAH